MKESKRKFLKMGLGAVAIGIAGRATGEGLLCNTQTAKQPSGPFYPENDQADKDNDLTWVQGSERAAEGEVIIINGKVTDSISCAPVAGALVEIWQACHTGKYNHSADPNTAKLDENFQYWGRAITNEQGEYEFKTIMPGAYPASNDWVRPSHIHCRVLRRGFEELVTQIYFKGTEHLQTDRLFLSIPQDQRESVVVDLQNSLMGPRQGEFNISINKVT